LKVNDVVFQDYQGIRRFGVITNKIIKEDRWAYVRVKWFGDQKYKKAMDVLSQMRGGNHFLDEYRIDQLHALNVNHEIDTLNKCKRYVNRRRVLKNRSLNSNEGNFRELEKVFE
jgi:hypothetical protein